MRQLIHAARRSKCASACSFGAAYVYRSLSAILQFVISRQLGSLNLQSQPFCWKRTL